MSVNEPIPKLKIRQIDIRTNAHATESLEVVKKTLQSRLLLDLTEKNYEIVHCSGQFGQRISSIIIHLKTQAQIKIFTQNFAQFLHSNDKNILNRTFHRRLDKKFKFHLKIDKHRNLNTAGILASSSDTIQIILMVQNKSPMIPLTLEILKKYYKELNLII